LKLGAVYAGVHYSINFSIQESFKKLSVVRHWWLTPVILATQEAEISRIAV
jgi:hypothetical protein